jgi:outer membrane protein assembly factor BamD (BamD/ComL family)
MLLFNKNKLTNRAEFSNLLVNQLNTISLYRRQQQKLRAGRHNSAAKDLKEMQKVFKIIMLKSEPE